MKYLIFEYAIQRPDGKYYKGTVRDNDEENWTYEKLENHDGAFHFTIEGAARKIQLFPEYFKDCKPVRIS